MHAATIQKAAELTSPGTGTSRDSKADRRTETRSPSTSISAPIHRSMRSVWSRDSAGWTTVVRSSANRPAIRTLDFTCALATGISKSMPFSPPPWMASGASEPPLRPAMRAPIRVRGPTILVIGLRRRERSPDMTLRNGWPAASPETSLNAVPLLLALSTFSGSRRPSGPTPSTSKHSSAPLTWHEECLRMRTPMPRRHRRTELRSSPTHRFETWAVPEAMAFRTSAR